MWSYYEFENEIAYVTRKLMSMGKGVNWIGTGQYSDNVLEYKPCPEMTELVDKLKSMEDAKGTIGGMRLMGITSRANNNFLGKNTTSYEMVVSFRGHYVSGSYIHDYTAAATYMKALDEKFPNINFQWLGYDSSNNHAYFFKFNYTVKNA